jgi:predicted phage terminase large subunit-like protein
MATKKPRFSAEQLQAALDIACRESFPEFVQVFHRIIYGKQFVTKSWHEELFALCDDIVNGRAPRSVVNIAPRSGKTFIMLCLCAWTAGRSKGTANFIIATYAEGLALKNSGVMQRIVTDKTYQRIFPGVEIDPQVTAKDAWQFTAGGCVRCVGQGGSVTGFGAGGYDAADPTAFNGMILCDDPHKISEASSAIRLSDAWEFFSESLMSRKNSPDTPVCVIAQRCNLRDVSGRLLEGALGSEWRHLKIPALQIDPETGEEISFFEEKFPLTDLHQDRQARPWYFSTQLQQSPYVVEGALANVEKIEIIDALPARKAQRVRAWDLASSEPKPGRDPDWTVGALLSIDDVGKVVIEEVIRFRGTPDKVKDAIKQTAALDSKAVSIGIFREPGQAGDAQVTDLVSMLKGYTVTPIRPTGSKPTAFSPFASQVNVGNVSCLSAGWTAALIEEMRAFPGGAPHDDQCDACGLAYNLLADLAGDPKEIEERRRAAHVQVAYRAMGGDAEAKEQLRANATGWAATLQQKADRKAAERAASIDAEIAADAARRGGDPLALGAVIGPNGATTLTFGSGPNATPEEDPQAREERLRQESNQQHLRGRLGLQVNESPIEHPTGIPRVDGDLPLRPASADDGSPGRYIDAAGNRYTRRAPVTPVTVAVHTDALAAAQKAAGDTFGTAAAEGFSIRLQDAMNVRLVPTDPSRAHVAPSHALANLLRSNKVAVLKVLNAR